MESSATSSHHIDPTRLPSSSLQRQAVASLFTKLRHSLSPSSPLPESVSLSLTSASLPAADQAVRELCRLVSASLVPPSDALLELQSALDGCSGSSSSTGELAQVFVKGIGFVVRFLFKTDNQWGRSGFDPVELHPFVKVLLCGEHVEMELIRQVSLFIIHNKMAGMKAVTWFLKPFFVFSVLRKSSLDFARDLISSVASISCSLKEEALLSLLVKCLKYFPQENEKELKSFLSSAACIVDAYVVILRQHDNQAPVICCVKMLEIFLQLCYAQRKPFGVTETILQLLKRLLEAQKELNLKFSPELYSVFVSISYVLSQAEFEHEQLAGLKLLLFLTEWRLQSELNKVGPKCLLREELLCVFPVVNLLISPSNSIKAMASRFLSTINGFIIDCLLSHPSGENACTMWAPVGPHSSALLRLLQHLLPEGRSTSISCSYLELITNGNELRCEAICHEGKHWTLLLRDYLKTICQEKSTLNVIQPGVSGFIGSVTALVITHTTLGPSAAETLAKVGAIDPKLAMPMLLIVLFYIRIFSSNTDDKPEMVVKLMESLAPFASHNFMVPVVLQTVLPMLKLETKPMVYATAVRLICKLWITNDRAFANLQKVLNMEEHAGLLSDEEIAISIAASVRDVCKNNPDRGVDLILSVSSCIESRDNKVQALGLEGLAYLCEADVVDFYTAWVVISKHILDYSLDPVVAYGLAKLLKWGAMDADAYPEASNNVIQILWDIATMRNSYSDPYSCVKARVAAFLSLSHYKVVHVQQAIPDFKKRNFECFISENNPSVLNAMEELEVEIIKFEHTTRKRGVKETRSIVSKAEKLLHVFPEIAFTRDRKRYSELPGAALICLDFAPKDESRLSIMKVSHRVNEAYETALLELAESLHVPRNLSVALLVMQSWKVFLDRWASALVNANAKNISPDVLDKTRKAAKDIFKILCKVATESVPRVAVNIALAIGALCLVIPSSEHFVISDASDFLFKWLYEYGHEHKQWSAAVSLGLVTSCFHPTDNKSKYRVINGLLEVIQTSESNLVRGACAAGLGYASRCLFRGVQDNITLMKSEEMKLLETIITTLAVLISKQYPSTVSSFQELLTEAFPGTPELTPEACDDFSDEDPWGFAGLALGLGISTFALYRAEAYNAVIMIKNLLLSWVANMVNEITAVPLCIGSCLALPMVISFCHRVELSRDNELDSLLNYYNLLISEVMQAKKSSGIYTDLIMAASMGAGSLISCIANDGVYSLRLDDLKGLLESIETVYTKAWSPLVQLGGLIGVVNAFGAAAGDLDQSLTQPIPFVVNAPKEFISLIRGPLLSNPSCESLCTSTIQGIFLLTKDCQDPQRRHNAAWALSFLRNQWFSRDFGDKDSSSNHSLSEETLVWDLSSWLRDLGSSQTDSCPQKDILVTVLRCLIKAPRLPSFDWGTIVRRSMRYKKSVSLTSTLSLREECLNFSFVHASHTSTLLHFLDDLIDLPRFMQLESRLQALLLENLSHLMRLFSGSRLEKLFGDIMQSLSLGSSSMLRKSLWKGLYNCFRENSDNVESSSFMHLRKCIDCMLTQLPGVHIGESQVDEFGREWSDAIKCLSLAPQSWLIDLLKVTAKGANGSTSTERNIDQGTKIIITARLVNSGSLPVSELGNLKAYILNAECEGSWWNVLLEVAKSVSNSEDPVKRQWLLDALEVSCVTEYPLKALRFIGLLCGFNCAYMPLLTVDPRSVLADLPLTLPSLLSDPNWSSVRSSVAEKLWFSANRVRTWADHLFDQDGPVDGVGIEETDIEIGFLLACVMHETCVALREHLPFDKQLKLANSEIL